MPALIVIGCILLFLALALFTRLKIVITYTDHLEIYSRFLFFKKQIHPEPEPQRGPRSMSAKQAQKIKEQLQKEKEEKQKTRLAREKKRNGIAKKAGTVSDIFDMLKWIKELLSIIIERLFKYLRVDVARFKINVATGDAATTAIAYGAVCDAVSTLLALLEPLRGFSSPKAKNLQINADYLSESCTADVKIVLSVRVWQTIYLAVDIFNTYVGKIVDKNK